MVTTIDRMAWLGLVSCLLGACGDDGESGSGGGGTDGTATSDDGSDGADDESGGQPPDENGDQCGDDVHGWQTMCLVEDVIASASDKGEIPGGPLAGEGTGRTLCCEGSPPVSEADAGCSEICQLEVCEAAKLDHMSRCDACGPWSCGFDMTKCLEGNVHSQLVSCAMPLQWPFSYTLTASCSAFDNETRNPDGSFGFLDQPDNQPGNDPPLCEPIGNLGHAPPRGLGQYRGSESDGTVARVTWMMAEAEGAEESESLDVLFEYAITPCEASASECLQLTALELALPTTEALGMTITGARLAVISVAEAPTMERGDRFRFSDGSIRVLVQADVNGYPLVLGGWNAGIAQGQVSPAGDQFSLTGLRFEFEDSVVAAALEIGIQGRYDARRPNAQITHVTAPASCTQAVTLLATSWDDDGDPLQHTWWIEGVGKLAGPLVEVVLPAGEHDVILTSVDGSGLFDTDTLRYDRRCQ